jgi:hypothetical protein
MEIEDLEQELMCEVLRCLHKFDESKGNLDHFIRKMLARRSINLLQYVSNTRRESFVNSKEYAEAKISECQNDNFIGDEMERLLVDFSRLANCLPSKYKALCRLLTDHSIAEASRIIGKSRASLYRDLKHISFLINHPTNSENQLLVAFFSGVNMKNLSIIETLSAKEIGALEIHDLMDLSDQVAKLCSHAKELKEKLDDGLNLKFSEAVKNNLRSENKDTGTTKFYDGAFQIVAEIPKKVTWDPEKNGRAHKTNS